MKHFFISVLVLFAAVCSSKAQPTITLVNTRSYAVTFTIGGSCSPSPGTCTDEQVHMLPPGSPPVTIPNFNLGIGLPSCLYPTTTPTATCPLPSFLWHYAYVQNYSGGFCSGGGLGVGDGNCSPSHPLTTTTFNTVTTPPPCVETYNVSWTVSPNPPFDVTVTAF